MRTRPIPSTGEPLGVVGVGTSRVFDVAGDADKEAECREVLQVLFNAGGGLIDTAPSYFSAQPLVGRLVESLSARDTAFLATKIMAEHGNDAQAQRDQSRLELRTPTVDLMQVHNLVAWRERLIELRRAKDSGTTRYIGLTHRSAESFETITQILRTESVDFIQIPYSLNERAAEDRLAPLAADLGVAIIANQPFGSGRLFARVRGLDIPNVAAEMGLTSWAQLFLAFALSHPAIIAAIPGTGRADHAVENVSVGARAQLSDDQRRAIIDAWVAL